MTPNVLVIMSDEHQARATGYAGHDLVQTPPPRYVVPVWNDVHLVLDPFADLRPR